MDWIDAEKEKPKWPCLVVDSFGNINLIRSTLMIQEKNGRKFYLDGNLYGERLYHEMRGEEEIKVCIWENRIRYWMPLPDIPREIADENGQK